MSAPGHNGVAADRLRSFVERIERLDEEIATFNADKRDVYAEAKAVGYDKAALREVVKLRKMDRGTRDERQSLVDLYMGALESGTSVATRARTSADTETFP